MDSEGSNGFGGAESAKSDGLRAERQPPMPGYRTCAAAAAACARACAQLRRGSARAAAGNACTGCTGCVVSDLVLVCVCVCVCVCARARARVRACVCGTCMSTHHVWPKPGEAYIII